MTTHQIAIDTQAYFHRSNF